MATSMRKSMFAGLFAIVFAGALGLALVGQAGTAWADDTLSLQSGTIASSLQEQAAPKAHKDGWELSNGKWHYWENGAKVKSTWIDTKVAPTGMKGAKSGKQRYWIDAHGNLAVKRVIDPKTAKDAGAYYAYATDKGCILIGKKKVAGNKYARVYLGKTSGSRPGELETGNKYGILRTTAYDNGTQRVYYINPDTHCALIRSNIQKAEPVKVKGFGWVFPCNKGGYLLAGKKKIIGKKVYLAKASGKLEDGGKNHVFGSTKYDKGTMRYYYIDPKWHCAVIMNRAVKVDGFGWVLPSNKNGSLATGRRVIGNKVYLARYYGRLETGNSLGFLTTNRYDENGDVQRYYINPKTNAITYGDPVYASGAGWVYAPNSDGALLRGITRVDYGHVVLADDYGIIYNEEGWLVTDKYAGSMQRYWIDTTEANGNLKGAHIGYFEVDGRLRLGQEDGDAIGSVIRDQYHYYGGMFYWVGSEGEFDPDYVVTSLYDRAQGYWSSSQYLIMVDTDDPKVMVLEGWQGNWSVKFIWDCCTGDPSTPSPVGTFYLGAKGWSFGEGNGYSCYYWSQITGDYLFHTRLYYPYEWELLDPRIGYRISHGCIRLYDEAAYWIWTECPSGTTIGCVL